MQCTWRDGKLLTLLTTGSLLVMTGAVIAPVLPKMILQLEIDPALAGYLVSAHYLTVAIFSPLLGILADRTGQVRVLTLSLLLYGVFGAVGGIMPDFRTILITRICVGAASGGIAAATLGLLVRRYVSEVARSQAIAYVATALTLANIVYPVLAGFIGGIHWRWVFGLHGLGLPLALIVAMTFQQPMFNHFHSQTTSTLESDAQKLKGVLQNPHILQLYATQGLTAAIAHATIIYLPLYLKATLNTGTVLNGLVLASQALGAAAISALGMRRLAQRIGLGGAASLGLGCMTVTLGTMPQFQRLLFLLPAVTLFGIGLGLVVPSLYSWVSNLAPAGLQSSVLAICVGANFLGQFIAPSIFGIVLNRQGLSSVFYGAAGLALILGLGLMLMQSSSRFKS